MKIVLDLSKSLEENAKDYFEQAKKARRKHKGVDEAIIETKKKLAIAEQEPVSEAPKRRSIRQLRKREWYEKFRWFISSDDILCIGGRDATTNEIVVKKHTDAADWVFHTDMAGSPFVVVKAKTFFDSTTSAATKTDVSETDSVGAGGRGDGPSGSAEEVESEIPDTTMEEAAQFCASNARAWKNGLAALEVFYVRPDQVTKEAQAGEHLPKGAFMIRGKTTYKHPQLKLAACIIEDGRVMIAPPSACNRHATGRIIQIRQGSEKTSDAAKRILQLLETDIPLDDIIRALPPGGVKIVETG